jgi:hypothetical protein
MNMVEFDGETYFDDRMFVLHVCKCTVAALDAQTLETRIFHEEAPPDHQWCLVTYKNTTGYPAVRADHFGSLEDARAYMEGVEPTVPRVSLQGRSPRTPLPFGKYADWKTKNGLKDYDYKQAYLPGGENPQEIVISRRQ